MLILAAHLLLAQLPAPPPPPPAPLVASPITEPVWYGWQTLIADGVALGLVAGGVAVQQAAPLSTSGNAGFPMMLAGVGVFLLGAPAIHFRHDHTLEALLSFARRLVFPVTAALLGFLFDAMSGNPAAPASLFGFAVLGPGACIAVDAVVVAWDRPPPPAEGPARVEWTPFLGAARGSPIAGVAARF
jgi:hypothetical protein